MKQSYSLYELNEYIRRVMALNFAEPIWINCEIAQIKESRGNHYLELVEQDEKDAIKAQISAVIWYRSYLFLKNKLGVLTSSLLSAGTHVQLKVNVDFNERYGLKLIIEDIDPSYTIGKLELSRQKILERLKQENVVELNKRIAIPRVIQRVAIISSETAAGYEDFINHCQNNPYNYSFSLTLFQSALQGTNTEREVCKALDEINENADLYDVIVIIRGGGSKLDLSYFDNFNIGFKIATSSLPVITGIGHEIDQSIADLVAAMALKTPTAVADFLVDHNSNFEADIVTLTNSIISVSQQNLQYHKITLENLKNQIAYHPQTIISNAMNSVIYEQKNIQNMAMNIIAQHKFKIDAIDNMVDANDPKHIYSKGYVTITQKGIIVKRGKNLKEEPFEINFEDKIRTAKTID